MRWPWRRRDADADEHRQSGGEFTDQVTRLMEAQAGTQAVPGTTAAVEAAAGALSRAFSSAEVVAADYAREAVTPPFLMQVGRDLVRHGESMHVIRFYDGMLQLTPAASWHWQNRVDDPLDVSVRVTTYGPSTSTTQVLPASGVVYVRWGGQSRRPIRRRPTSEVGEQHREARCRAGAGAGRRGQRADCADHSGAGGWWCRRSRRGRRPSQETPAGHWSGEGQGDARRDHQRGVR